MSALSSHLLEQYYTFHRSRAPFGQPLHASQLATCGPMSYMPQMHGAFPSQPAFAAQSRMEHDSSMILTGVDCDTSMSAADVSVASALDLSTTTAQKIASLQAKLDKRLGPEYISQRPGPGGGPKLTYVEGWKVINLANEVFGFNGWSSSIVNLNTDFIDYSEETRRFSVGVSAVVRVTLRDGTYHEDVGYGLLENSKSKGAALDKSKKEAVTDGIKRALRNFGNVMGNCLYDKSYAQEVIKIKVPPPKFDKSALHRRPEFDDLATTSNQTTTTDTPPAASKPAIPPIIPKALGTGATTNLNNRSISAIPPHIRPNSTSTPARNTALGPATTGLNTPGQTPLGKAGPGGPVPRPLSNGANASISKPLQRLAPQQPNQPPRLLPRPNGAVTNGGQPAQPSRLQPVAQQQRQQQQLAPLKALEREDTYSFNSEDDALFAEQFDLVDAQGGLNEREADLGRPIASDEGVGRAINYDEGGSDVNIDHSMSATSSKTGSNVTNAASAQLASSSGGSKQQGQDGPACHSAGDAQAAQRPQQPHQAPASASRTVPDPAPTSDDMDDIGMQILALRRQRNASRSVNQTPQASNESAASAPTSKPVPQNVPAKPRAPSMGGFNFPQEMSQVGAKRSIDVMSSRGPGMGLAQSEAQALQANSNRVRQPLATIEGGDLKRARR